MRKIRRKLTNYFVGEPDDVPASEEIWFYGFYAIMIAIPVFVILL